jgi:hypothetical protein
METGFKPRGTGVFSDLCTQFYEIMLQDSNNVLDYTEKLRRMRNELIALHPTLDLPEPHWVQKFLHGLGPEFAIFKTTFNQTTLSYPRDPKTMKQN